MLGTKRFLNYNNCLPKVLRDEGIVSKCTLKLVALGKLTAVDSTSPLSGRLALGCCDLWASHSPTVGAKIFLSQMNGTLTFTLKGLLLCRRDFYCAEGSSLVVPCRSLQCVFHPWLSSLCNAKSLITTRLFSSYYSLEQFSDDEYDCDFENQQASSTVANVDDWKWKLSMLLRSKNDQEIVSRDIGHVE
ncbi:DExH-box ATP-dependent RNA helicase DExH3 [Glycine soja]